jgi:hypothetical protein
MSEAENARYPYFGVPPARQPQPAESVPALRGKRLVLSTPDGFVHDMRAISEIQEDRDGRPVVDVASEEDYFRWMLTGEAPRSEAYPTRLVWVE